MLPRRIGAGQHRDADELGVVLMVAVVLVGLWWTWVEVKDIAAIVVPAPLAVLDDLTAPCGPCLRAASHTMLTAFITLMMRPRLGVAAALATFSRFRFVAGMSVPFMVLLSGHATFALFPVARLILLRAARGGARARSGR